MSLTNIDVANRMLALIGANAITAFDDGSAEATFITQIYEGLVQAELTAKPWRFAIKQAELDMLTAEPVGRWSVAHQLPSDLLRLLAVTCNDYPIEYDRYDDMVYSESDASDTLVADYIYRVDESLWLPYFTQGIVYLGAGLLGGAIARDAALVEKYEKMGRDQIARAANVEAQSQSSKRVRTTRFLAARGRAVGGFRDDGY